MIFGARIPAALGPPLSRQAKRSAERVHLQRIVETFVGCKICSIRASDNLCAVIADLCSGCRCIVPLAENELPLGAQCVAVEIDRQQVSFVGESVANGSAHWAGMGRQKTLNRAFGLWKAQPGQLGSQRGNLRL
jgi:hypothetical protein